MISIKSDREIELMKEAGRLVGETHKYLKQFIKEGRTLPSRKNKDFYERMATKFGYKNPQSIYRIVLGCTNRFFGENIVQTTNRNGNENCSGKGELN